MDSDRDVGVQGDTAGGYLGHTRVLGVRKRRQNTAQERGRPRSPAPTLQVPGGAWPPPPPSPPRHRSGPGFNHPSITRCLLLSTAHLLALVKHAVNSERNSPALPEQGNGQEGAGRAPPPAARSQHRSQRCREGLGRRIGPRLLAPSAATGATPALKSAEDPPPPSGNKRSARPGLPRPKVRATKCPSFFSLKIFYIFQTQPAIIPAVISGHGGRRKSNQPF